MTNFEKIKNMSVDEIAKYMIDFFGCPYDIDHTGCVFDDDCIKCTKQWLESEVEE